MALVKPLRSGYSHLLPVAAATLALVCATAGAAAPKYRLAHDFCSDANCGDGIAPRGGLAFDAAGTMYGVTERGGANSAGTVFAQTADGRFRTLHDFCAQSCADGNAPRAGLAIDVNGSLYGSTPRGGSEGGGSIFRLSRDPGHATWKITTLHGQFWRQSMLVDLPEGKMAEMTGDFLHQLNVQRAGWQHTLLMAAGLAGGIVVLYLFLNAATKGYYTWTLRLVGIAAVAAGIIMVLTMA